MIKNFGLCIFITVSTKPPLEKDTRETSLYFSIVQQSTDLILLLLFYVGVEFHTLMKTKNRKGKGEMREKEK